MSSVIASSTDWTGTTSYNTTNNGTVWTTSTPTIHQAPKHDYTWVIPTLFGMFFFLVGMAWFLFYFIKKCELMTLSYCYRKFGLCPPDKRDSMLYNSLGEDNDTDSDTLYLRGKMFTVTPKDDTRMSWSRVKAEHPTYSAMTPTTLVLDGQILKPPPPKGVQ